MIAKSFVSLLVVVMVAIGFVFLLLWRFGIRFVGLCASWLVAM